MFDSHPIATVDAPLGAFGLFKAAPALELAMLALVVVVLVVPLEGQLGARSNAPGAAPHGRAVKKLDPGRGGDSDMSAAPRFLPSSADAVDPAPRDGDFRPTHASGASNAGMPEPLAAEGFLFLRQMPPFSIPPLPTARFDAGSRAQR